LARDMARLFLLASYSFRLFLGALAAEYHWIVQEDVAAPDGYPRSVLAVLDSRFLEIIPNPDQPYNNKLIYHKDQQIPGPELHVRQGERVVVHIENRLPSTEISVHWHGLHMKDQAWMDGTAGVTGCPIAGNGGTGTYNFTVDQPPGTHWWHSHVSTQYADGIYGVIVIEPAEGEVDPVKERTPYTDDQVVTLQDWVHETYHDVSTRYNTRIGAFTQHYSRFNVTLPFMPDYPWPSSFVLLNGRGQTDCKWRLWKDCSEIRLKGWAYYFNHTLPPETPKQLIGGLPVGTYGQCMPERPPLMGECSIDAEPAVFRCRKGGATRFRLVNTGYSMPLRFWIDRHTFMVVARDGLPIEPTGPHNAIVLNLGQRIDIVVQCDQDPQQRYKAFAMVALHEFYPGAYWSNREASSYAVLDYGSAPDAPLAKPEVAPHQFVQAGLTWGCTIGCNYRERIYSSWRISADEYLPFAIESRTTPLPRDGGKPVMAPPAQERLLISVSGMGNWWNNESNAESQFGRKFEWWSLSSGGEWRNNHAPLFTPPEPVMIGRLFGRGLDEVYGTKDPNELPFVQHLKYNRTSPLTYEVVMINHEGQQHPWHIHGHTLQMLANGWIDPKSKWAGAGFNGSGFDAETIMGPVPYDKPSPVLSELDSFTLAPHSYVVFRLTANNPGAWMMHCHMDYHLDAGQGMLWSVESEGGYPLPPPPADFRMCHRDATYGTHQAQLAATQELLQAAEDERAQLQQQVELYTSLLVGIALAAAAAATALLLRAAVSSGRERAQGWSSVPQVFGSPAGSYHGVSD